MTLHKVRKNITFQRLSLCRYSTLKLSGGFIKIMDFNESMAPGPHRSVSTMKGSSIRCATVYQSAGNSASRFVAAMKADKPPKLFPKLVAGLISTSWCATESGARAQRRARQPPKDSPTIVILLGFDWCDWPLDPLARIAPVSSLINWLLTPPGAHSWWMRCCTCCCNCAQSERSVGGIYRVLS